MWFLSIRRKLTLGVVRRLLFSSSSSSNRALLEFSIAIDSLEIPLLQLLRSCPRILNFRDRTVAMLAERTSLDQQ